MKLLYLQSRVALNPLSSTFLVDLVLGYVSINLSLAMSLNRFTSKKALGKRLL